MTSLQTAESRNPYLEGFLAPVAAEVTATDLEVTGNIPEHLDGRYLRNGPNPAAEVDPATYHWFTGDGMVHGLALRDGKARWYRNRWVRSPAVCATLGEPVPGRIDPRAGMQSLGANTNVLSHAGKTLALVEGGVANYELTQELDTVGTCDFDGTLAGGYTAHPHRDPRTGELHAISYSFARGRTVQYSVIDTGGRARRTVDIEVSGSPMMHDFSLTDKYVVIYDLPVTFDPVQVMPASVPRWLQLPARLVMESVIGRVRIPARSRRWPTGTSAGRSACRTPGTPTIRRASASCPAKAATRRPVVRHRTVLRLPPAQRLFGNPQRLSRGRNPGARRGPLRADVRPRPARARREPAHPGPVDHQPGNRRGQHRMPRRPVAGVSPDQREPDGRPAPVRLRRRHRRWVRRRGRDVDGAVQARLRERVERDRRA